MIEMVWSRQGAEGAIIIPVGPPGGGVPDVYEDGVGAVMEDDGVDALGLVKTI